MPESSLKALKRAARKMHVYTKDILALSPTIDPFAVGRPADYRKARWAKEIWDWVMIKWEERREQLIKLGYRVGRNPHLRAIHYLYLTGYGKPINPINGRAYTGTNKDWRLITESFAKAKILGMIPFGVMEDRKHPDAQINLDRGSDVSVSVDKTSLDRTYDEESVEYGLPIDNLRSELEIRNSYAEEYKNIQKRLPYHLEFWIEKESELVNEIAKKYFVNVQPSVGEQTWENIIALLQRAKSSSQGKPMRIFYITDFDPRGEMSMPKAVARKIEWLTSSAESFKGMDIKLKKVILTKAQCEEFDLPPAPVKPKESMRKKWISKFGDEVVELNAMETLHAPDFARVLEETVEPYMDEDAIGDIEEFNTRLKDAVEKYNDAVEEEIKDQSTKIKAKLDALIKPALKGFESNMSIDVSGDAEDVKSVLESWEDPDWKDPEENDEWLFDSKRSYSEQLARYKELSGASPTEESEEEDE